VKKGAWFRRLSGGGGGLVLFILVAIVAVIWLLTGIYIVQPGEQGVVRQFGKFVAVTSPGLNYHLPWPFQRVDVVDMAQIRKVEVGFRTVSPGPPPTYQSVPVESLMLTQDKNIVDAQLLVQYRVRDPMQYLFKVKDVEKTLHAATEVALRSVVGNATIDEVIREKRAEIQDKARAFLQEMMDSYESGIQITEAKLLFTGPPEQVKDAFDEVVRAIQDKQKMEREAEGYEADVVPRAEGDKKKKIAEATGYKNRVIALATGEAARFESILAEYSKAPEVTRQRLYLETIEKVLPDINKVVVDLPEGNLLLLLPTEGAPTLGTLPGATPTPSAR
jgi:membrane protease subunit HflK